MEAADERPHPRDEVENIHFLRREELHTIAPILGHECRNENATWMACKSRDEDPFACVGASAAIHKCGLRLALKMREEFPKEYLDMVGCYQMEGNWRDCMRTQERFNDFVGRRWGGVNYNGYHEKRAKGYHIW